MAMTMSTERVRRSCSTVPAEASSACSFAALAARLSGPRRGGSCGTAGGGNQILARHHRHISGTVPHAHPDHPIEVYGVLDEKLPLRACRRGKCAGFVPL